MTIKIKTNCEKIVNVDNAHGEDYCAITEGYWMNGVLSITKVTIRNPRCIHPVGEWISPSMFHCTVCDETVDANHVEK